MTRTASRQTPPAGMPQTSARDVERDKDKGGTRETIESLVVAFIGALMIRVFAAEAFVIPTGSMAPTLMGRHKEVSCPQCGAVFVVNAYSEVSDDSHMLDYMRRVDYGTCWNCRFRAPIGDLPSYKGDRILVSKVYFDLPFLPGSGPPSRWDVIVFHYPEMPEQQNYIKRLVGLPGETLRVEAGDLLSRPTDAPADRPFELNRKPPIHLRAMMVPVYDDTRRPATFRDMEEWRRWVGDDWAPDGEAGYAAESSPGAGWTTLGYHHRVPDPSQWRAALARSAMPHPPRDSLITDFYSYNTNETVYSNPAYGEAIPTEAVDAAINERRLRHVPTRSLADITERSALREYEPHWVGDLMLEGTLDVRKAEGKARFELVKGGVPYRCEIDLATGRGRFLRGDDPLGEEVDTGLKGAGTFGFAFANVDGRLTLWVDGRMPFGDGVAYDDDADPRPAPTAADLIPAAVAVHGGAAARVSGLVLKRDIYYTQSPRGFDEYDTGPSPFQVDPDDQFRQLADPEQFEVFAHPRHHDFEIGPDRYMMMGDNSPMSKDGRAWGRADLDWDDETDRQAHEVPRSMLVGKAFFVYWPHGVPFWPNVGITRDFRVPFRPYVERMQWIR